MDGRNKAVYEEQYFKDADSNVNSRINTNGRSNQAKEIAGIYDINAMDNVMPLTRGRGTIGTMGTVNGRNSRTRPYASRSRPSLFRRTCLRSLWSSEEGVSVSDDDSRSRRRRGIFKVKEC